MQTQTAEERRGAVGTPEDAPRTSDARPPEPSEPTVSTKPSFRRRKYWIDSRSQLPMTLLAFVVVTFFVIMFNVVMLDLAQARREFIVDAVPSMQAKLEAQDRDLQRLLAVSSTLLIACVMAGVVILTHRSAGPVRRVQNHMRRVAGGDLAHTVTLRNRDHFKSLADEFNIMMRALRKRAQEDAQALEQLAHRARSGGSAQEIVSGLEHLAREKRTSLPG